MSVGEIETMLGRAREHASFKMFLPPKLEADLKKGMSPPVQRLFRLVQQQQLAQVLGAVRNRLFDWTIELQTREVSVDGDFPNLPGKKTKERSEPVRTIQTNNYVEVREAMQSPVQMGTRDSSQQTSYQGVDIEQVAKLVAALEQDLAALALDADLRALDEVETIKRRPVLKSPSPEVPFLAARKPAFGISCPSRTPRVRSWAKAMNTPLPQLRSVVLRPIPTTGLSLYRSPKCKKPNRWRWAKCKNRYKN